MASVINKEDVNNQSNQVVIDKPKANIIIRQKRGEYDENVLSRLKDGEIFYDTTGVHGIYMGVYNPYTKKNETILIANNSEGGITAETLKVADVVAVLEEGIIYDVRKVLSANAGQTLKSNIFALDTRVTELESSLAAKVKEEIDKYLAQCKVLTEDSLISGGSISITKDQESKLTISVVTNGTLQNTSDGLSTSWVSYNE